MCYTASYPSKPGMLSVVRSECPTVGELRDFPVFGQASLPVPKTPVSPSNIRCGSVTPMCALRQDGDMRQTLTRKPRALAYRHDLRGWTVATMVSLVRDGAQLQLVPTPSTGHGWPVAGTVQGPFFGDSGSQRYQVRPVAIRTETDQISSKAHRTLDAMAETGGRYGTSQSR